MKKYGKDYRRTDEGYAYTGSWYKTALDGDALKQTAQFFWIFLAIMSAQFVLGLSLNNAGSRIAWILIPFILLFLPILYGWMGSVRLYGIGKRLKKTAAQQAGAEAPEAMAAAQAGNEEAMQQDLQSQEASGLQIPKEHRSHLRRSEYEQSFRRLLRSFVSGAVLANAVFLADILVLVSDMGSGSWRAEAVFAGNAAVLAVLNLLCAVKSWQCHASVIREEVSVQEKQKEGNYAKK